ncbi:MAG: hypothetical protein H0V57_05775, partial [Thermoleophilaceae bacterium]|nr:hypothetical protein [Thermoleophilaceae bacterium]
MAGIGRAARCPRLLALARARLLTGLTRLGISAVVAIVAAAALLVACGGAASADEVRFQNVSDPGPEPFTAPALAQDPPQPT